MKYFYWLTIAILGFVLIYFVLIPSFAGQLNIPAEINLGSFAIKLYGLTMALAILAGYLIARRHSWRYGISPTEMDDVAFWITIVGLLGARVYYVLFEWKFFSNDYTEIYKVWHGGLSIYGAIIAGIIFIYFYTRKKAYSGYQLLDLAALALPVGQAIGRFGNFFNQEAYGTPTNLPWKMYVAAINRPGKYLQYEYFHPAFLYEALWDILIFVFLMKFLVGKVKTGVIAFTYLALYSLGRFFIESIRLDSSYIYGMKVDQITAVIGLLVAGVFIAMRTKKAV